jgi:Type II CAAX prenyl endopeptidase Rce1-like
MSATRSRSQLPEHPYLGVLLMTIFTTLLGVIFGWLQLASGSVWVPTLAHASLNAVAGMPFLLLTPFDTAVGGMLTSLIGWSGANTRRINRAGYRILLQQIAPRAHINGQPADGAQPCRLFRSGMMSG